MNNDLFYAAESAVDREFVNRSLSGSEGSCDNPIPRNEHAMSFVRQVSEGGKCGGADAIFRIRNIVPDYDRIHRHLQQYFGAKKTSWDCSQQSNHGVNHRVVGEASASIKLRSRSRLVRSCSWVFGRISSSHIATHARQLPGRFLQLL